MAESPTSPPVVGTHVPAGYADPAGPTEISLLDLATMLLRHRRLIVLPPLVLFVLVVGFTLLKPRTWTATASFIPQSSASSLSRLAGFAAQLGVAVPGGEPGASPDFYADFLGSDQLLRALVSGRYTVQVEGEARQGTLVDFYEIEEADSAVAREKAVEALRDDFGVSTNVKSGLVSLSVHAKYPALAQQVAQEALDRVNELNLQIRQARAAAEKEFIEGRLTELNAELRAAEDRLQAFLQQNRDFSNSPQLRFTHDRLQRAVDLQQQVYLTLSQGYEQARIDALRNTPVIGAVERPIVPARPDRRGTVIKGLLALILGTLAGVGLALARESMRATALQNPDGVSQFSRLRQAAMSDLRHPVRALKEGLRESPPG